MSQKKLESDTLIIRPFTTRITAPGKSDFDKYYIDRSVKTVFKSTGQKDDEGNELGVESVKIIDKKIDITEMLESQRDSVGVESYIKALAIQGDSIDDYATQVDLDKVNDYSSMPDTLADAMTAGDKAREAFANMDPALKGDHTTIEGFINSLSQEKIDNYLKARLEALMPSVENKGEN